MPAFQLPALSKSASPEFTTVTGCTDWLQSLPLINVGPSHGRILGELEELNTCEITTAERLKILEAMLEPILFVQAEHAKKFSSRAVPLAKLEREVLLNVTALWHALGTGYQHCMLSFGKAATRLLAGSGQLALVSQRAIWCTTQILQEHYKCYLDIAPDDWAMLHSLYAFAEERMISGDPVDHPVHKSSDKTSCMDTYAQALLLNAANPNEQTSRQIAIAVRWLDHWGHKIMVSAARPSTKETDSRPLASDISGSTGPVRAEPSDVKDTLRFLAVDDLSNSLRKRVALLRKGDTPASLGLGEDLAPQFAEQLLLNLHRLWCEDRQPRSQARKSTTGKTDLAFGMTALHFHISGSPFHQPSSNAELSKTQREEIATFGRIATRDEDAFSKLQISAIEAWQIIDESIAGLRLERLSGQNRYVHAQLVAARPADSSIFMLGTIRWLAVDPNYVAKLGVRLIPGIPRGVAIRATGINAMADKYLPALALSAVAALKSPESLVLPVGWFKPQRVIDVFDERSKPLRLTRVLDRGTDFERVSFEPA